MSDKTKLDSAGLIVAVQDKVNSTKPDQLGSVFEARWSKGYGDAVQWDVEALAQHLCNASGGDWGRKNTKRQLWRQRAAEQIAAEIAAIPPLIPPYWQGFATATGLAVVGYVLQAVFA